jgi:predicted porin
MLRFEQGPVRLGISQTAQTTAKAADITGGAVAKAKETIVGGSYALGTLRIGVAYAMDKPEDVACTTLATCDSTAATVQFDMPVASGVNVFGSYNAYTSKLADADGNGISLGVSQALSKRTKLFAAYNKNKNDTNATNTYRNGPSATAGQDNSRAVVGVSHSF